MDLQSIGDGTNIVLELHTMTNQLYICVYLDRKLRRRRTRKPSSLSWGYIWSISGNRLDVDICRHVDIPSQM